MVEERVLTNYMEDMVTECIESLLRVQPNVVCSCPRCLTAVKMEALNRLPTFYVTSKVGEVYGEYRMKQQQYNADIAIAVSRAIEAVVAQGHGENE